MPQFTFALAPTNKIHDFDIIAVAHDGLVEDGAFENDQVVLDGHTPGVDGQRLEERCHAHGPRNVQRVAVQCNVHGFSETSYLAGWLLDKDQRMPIDREAALSWYHRNRERSRALFAMLPADAYYHRPIELRHPVVFYDGHLPGFSFNTLVKKALGGPSIDARLESLFARGIDPPSPLRGFGETSPHHPAGWPDRETVRAFVAEADTRVVDPL